MMALGIDNNKKGVKERSVYMRLEKKL